MIKIAFFDTKEYDKKLFDRHNDFGYNITYFETKLNHETAPLAFGYDVVCVFVNDEIDRETIEILKKNKVKLIALRCAGFNNVAVEALDDEIMAVRVPSYSPHAVAEHATALLLEINRKIYKAYQRTKKYNFTLNGLVGFDIYEKTVGVLGTGKIGKAFCKIMKGFGAEVLAYDVFHDNDASKEIGFKYTDLNEIFEKSDIISLHCPLTAENEKMINSEAMERMKNGVIIINTSRGKLIDTEALLNYLEKGKIFGVGLDVFDEESDYFMNDMSSSYKRNENLSLLLSMPNVIITSHQAFFTQEALNKIAHDSYQNIKEIFETGDCINRIK